jgi:hypothetical protein
LQLLADQIPSKSDTSKLCKNVVPAAHTADATCDVETSQALPSVSPTAPTKTTVLLADGSGPSTGATKTRKTVKVTTANKPSRPVRSISNLKVPHTI